MKINSIVNFIIKEGDGLYDESHRDDLTKAISGHVKYGTLITLSDPGGVYALARLNLEKGIPFVIDTVIRKDKRGLRTIKDLIRQGRSQFPEAKQIKFKRNRKYHDKKLRSLNITKI